MTIEKHARSDILMKLLSGTTTLFVITLLAHSSPAHATPYSVGTQKALACTHEDQCPYFGEVFVDDSTNKKRVMQAFKESRHKKPRWVERGVETPVMTLKWQDTTWIVGKVCEPHNCTNRLIVVYDPAKRHLSGHRYNEEDDQQYWIGKPSAQEKQILTDLYRERTALFQKHQQANKQLPVMLD